MVRKQRSYQLYQPCQAKGNIEVHVCTAKPHIQKHTKHLTHVINLTQHKRAVVTALMNQASDLPSSIYGKKKKGETEGSA